MATRACPPLANLPRLAVEKLAYSGYKVEAGDSLSAVGEQWKALTGDVRNAWPPSREKVVVDVPAGFAEKAVRTVAGCFRGTVPTYEQSFVFADYVQLWYHLGTAAKPASRAQVAAFLGFIDNIALFLPGKPVVFGSLFASRKGAEDVLRQFEDGTWVLRVSDAVADHEVTADALVKEAATQPLALMLSIRLAGGSVVHSVLALPAADGKVAMRDGQGKSHSCTTEQAAAHLDAMVDSYKGLNRSGRMNSVDGKERRGYPLIETWPRTWTTFGQTTPGAEPVGVAPACGISTAFAPAATAARPPTVPLPPVDHYAERKTRQNSEISAAICSIVRYARD